MKKVIEMAVKPIKEIEVKNSEGNEVTLMLVVDPSSNAIVGVESSFLEVTNEIQSPYNKNVTLVVQEEEENWEFDITETNLENRFEVQGGRGYELRIEWTGQIEAFSPVKPSSGSDSRYRCVFADFNFKHVVLTDNGGDSATITSERPKDISESEWDEIVDQMEDFICSEYRKHPFEES